MREALNGGNAPRPRRVRSRSPRTWVLSASAGAAITTRVSVRISARATHSVPEQPPRVALTRCSFSTHVDGENMSLYANDLGKKVYGSPITRRVLYLGIIPRVAPRTACVRLPRPRQAAATCSIAFVQGLHRLLALYLWNCSTSINEW